ncbi:hypothetical protein DEU56DRAFT_793027, partial [Suillus clintonianus]|uniref:uncharacterized protein n=1 Tax=Suillus clintonianus TaxID=1904413 RepID=UPI001B881F16
MPRVYVLIMISTAAEYLALLAVQAELEPNESSGAKDNVLEVSADFIINLIEARWKAEKERCDAECKAQLLEMKNLPRV